jgi:hypothetical protein
LEISIPGRETVVIKEAFTETNPRILFGLLTERPAPDMKKE